MATAEVKATGKLIKLNAKQYAVFVANQKHALKALKPLANEIDRLRKKAKVLRSENEKLKLMLVGKDRFGKRIKKELAKK